MIDGSCCGVCGTHFKGVHNLHDKDVKSPSLSAEELGFYNLSIGNDSKGSLGEMEMPKSARMTEHLIHKKLMCVYNECGAEAKTSMCSSCKTKYGMIVKWQQDEKEALSQVCEKSYLL